MNKAILLVFIFSNNLVFASDFDSVFYAHLKENGLHLERFAFLKEELQARRILDKEKTHDFYKLIRLQEDSLLFSKLELEQLSNDSSNLKLGYYLSIHFKNEGLGKQFLYLLKTKVSASSYEFLHACYDVTFSTNFVSVKHTEFDNIQQYRFQMEKKKAWIAAMLSALIPGMGKVYLGQKQTGFTEFVMFMTVGMVPLEMMLLGGVITAGVIVGVGLFLPFYFSGIYTAYLVRKTELKRTERELKNEIQNYCNFLFAAN